MAMKKDPLKSALSKLGAEDAEAPTRPRAASLVDRSTALGSIGDGSRQDKIHRLVDPALVRPWAYHNRRYEDLNERNCADLIAALKSQGQQEFPAIVRRVANDSEHQFEFICGARRHFAVSWLRAHDFPRFRYLIEVRDLSDEEAFRLSDVENRNRDDISDYERSLDYRTALETYYDGAQKRMAERLEVSQAWLSQFLDLAKLPDDVVRAFGSPHEIRVHHSRTLKPLLKAGAQGPVIGKARELASVQAERRQGGQAPLKATTVVSELKAAAKAPPRKRSPARSVAAEVDGERYEASINASGRRTVIELQGLRQMNEEAFLAVMRAVYRETR